MTQQESTMQSQQSPEEIARQRLQEQEQQERQQKLDTLTREEAQRRRTEEQERAAEERRRVAEEKAGELGRRRMELEGQAEARMLALKNVLHELKEVDAEHRSAVRESGKSLGGAGYQTVNQAVREWVKDTLLRDAPRPRTLSEIDLFAESTAPERRAPAQGLPGSDPRDGERLEASRFLNALDQRASKLRIEYGRTLQFHELISEAERDYFDGLSKEQRGQIQAMLTGETANRGEGKR